VSWRPRYLTAPDRYSKAFRLEVVAIRRAITNLKLVIGAVFRPVIRPGAVAGERLGEKGRLADAPATRGPHRAPDLHGLERETV
jgi:hypothetical protein